MSSGLLNSAPLMLPGRHALNLGLLGGNLAAMGWYLWDTNPMVGLGMLGITTGLSSIMGITLTVAIGGKISLTNSLSCYQNTRT